MRGRLQRVPARGELQRPLRVRRPVDGPRHEVRHARTAWDDRRVVGQRGAELDRPLGGHRMVGTGPPDHRLLALPRRLPPDHLGVLRQRQLPLPGLRCQPRRRADLGPRAARHAHGLRERGADRAHHGQRKRQLLPRQQGLQRGRGLLDLPQHQRRDNLERAPAAHRNDGDGGDLELRGGAGLPGLRGQRTRDVDRLRQHALLRVLEGRGRYLERPDDDRPADRPERHRLPGADRRRAGHGGPRLPRGLWRGHLERVPDGHHRCLQPDAADDYGAGECVGRPPRHHR